MIFSRHLKFFIVNCTNLQNSLCYIFYQQNPSKYFSLKTKKESSNANIKTRSRNLRKKHREVKKDANIPFQKSGKRRLI